MSNTERHLLLCEAFGGQGYIMKHRQGKNIISFQESASLVHYGHRERDPHNLTLVDVDNIESLDIINHLYSVKPDFIVFQNNKCIWNQKRNRLAGYPDLVVEVWSDGNTKIDKEEKFLIYSNSQGKTEHWYIEQDSNDIICYIGTTKLPSQSLKYPLKTQNGLEFDLTYLVL